jgi:DNA-binding NarL/FixJ family response regulator
MKSQDEQYIIELIREGKTNKEIGATIYKSEGMVKYYVSCLLEKYNCKKRVQLALINNSVSHETNES